MRHLASFLALAGAAGALAAFAGCYDTDDCFSTRTCDIPTTSTGGAATGSSAGANASSGSTGGSGGSQASGGAGGSGGMTPLPPLQPGAIATGGFHTCVIRPDTSVRCWGRNEAGQLGTGSISQPSGPVTVLGLGAIDSLTAGTNFTCGLKPSGSVYCWGANAHGQLGTGSFAPLTAPGAAVQGLTTVTAINALAYSVCALRSNGSVSCWGDDVDNTLGDSNNPQTCESYMTPITCPVNSPQQANVTGAVLLARGLPRSEATGAGNRSCVARGDNSIWCWCPGLPAEVGNLASITTLSIGSAFTCATKLNGSLTCVGSSNSFGQLGSGSTTFPPGGVSDVSLPLPAVLVATGGYTTCAVLEDRTVMCWGRNDYGQLGNGSTQGISASPVAVTGLADVVSMAMSPDHACALLGDQTVWCWGRNDYAQLGNGSVQSGTPIQVQGL